MCAREIALSCTRKPMLPGLFILSQISESDPRHLDMGMIYEHFDTSFWTKIMQIFAK